MRNKINNLKKRNENLKEKKIICDKNIEKYEKIIQKNKEYIQNLKQNNDEIDEGRNKKRKYMTHTLNQRQVNQVNNLRIMTEENNILQRNNKPGETEEEIENIGNIELTNGNLIMEYLPNYNTNESRNKIIPKINIKKSPETKSYGKENKSRENIKDKNNSGKSKEKKNIIITKNTKIILRKSGKQPKINNSSKQKENPNNENVAESKTINSNSNQNYFDDSKDADSEVNSRNLNNSNNVSNNNNIYPNNLKKKNIKIIRPNVSATNNNINKRYNNYRKEKTVNNNK